MCEPIPEKRVNTGPQLDPIRDHAFFISSSHGDFALRGSMLSENTARATLRDIQCGTNTINAGTAASGA